MLKEIEIDVMDLTKARLSQSGAPVFTAGKEPRGTGLHFLFVFFWL